MSKDITPVQDEIIRDLINDFRAAKRHGLKIVSVHGLLFAMNEDVDIQNLSLIEVDKFVKTARLGCTLGEMKAS